jgi:hypothetical protein
MEIKRTALVEVAEPPTLVQPQGKVAPQRLCVPNRPPRFPASTEPSIGTSLVFQVGLRLSEAFVMRKLIEFDDETLDKLKQLGQSRMATLQELADEAFADLLRKHGVPVDLRDALRKSATAGGRTRR